MCLDDQVLSTYIDGELVEPWKTQVEEHISHCSECRQRYEKLLRMQNMLTESQLREDEFAPHKARVWKYLEKTCMTSQPVRFRHRGVLFSKPVLSAAAAALVVLAGLNFFIFRGVQGEGSPDEMPVIDPAVQSSSGNGNLLSISTTKHETAQMSPEDLSVEQLVKLLDSKGFNVELKLKNSLTPVTPFDSMEQPDSGGQSGNRELSVSAPAVSSDGKSEPSDSSDQDAASEEKTDQEPADNAETADNENEDSEHVVSDDQDADTLGITSPRAQEK